MLTSMSGYPEVNIAYDITVLIQNLAGARRSANMMILQQDVRYRLCTTATVNGSPTDVGNSTDAASRAGISRIDLTDWERQSFDTTSSHKSNSCRNLYLCKRRSYTPNQVNSVLPLFSHETYSIWCWIYRRQFTIASLHKIAIQILVKAIPYIIVTQYGCEVHVVMRSFCLNAVLK